MKASWIKLVAACGVLGVVCPASAGHKYTFPVYVNYTYSFAEGSLGSARNSADSQQEIECNVQSGGWGYCYARDASGNFANCYANTEAHFAAIRAINGDSGVFFNWDSYGYCGTIIVYQGSSREPKQP
jgi:hypothetical protein